MPIYYACESEEQAKEVCLSMGGQYTGRSNRILGRYTWKTFDGACITSFVRPTTAGADRFMVVYNERTDSFETIAIGGDSPTPNRFVTGGDTDAPADMRTRYARYQYERESARFNAKRLLLSKARCIDEARLRRLRGKLVKVIAGTTIRHGTTGSVFWVGFGQKGDARVGFYDANGNRRWTSLKNVCEVQEMPLFAKAS